MESQTGGTEVETDSNMYLYCFFRGTASFAPQKGIDRVSDTLVLSYKELCAMVSPVPAGEYNEESLNQRLQDLEWLTPKVKRHQEIIRHVMEFCPVAPIRFGTIYTSDKRVMKIMRSGYDELCSHLDFISGKEEWGVKVYAEEGAGRKTIETSSQAVIRLNEGIASAKSAGQTYLLKKKRENLIRQQAADLLNSVSDKIYQQMLSWCIDGRRNKVLGRKATGKKSDMILNAAFLLDKLSVAAFKEKIDALAARYQEDAISFEISGPWPCYNFCPDFEALVGLRTSGL